MWRTIYIEPDENNTYLIPILIGALERSNPASAIHVQNELFSGIVVGYQFDVKSPSGIWKQKRPVIDSYFGQRY